MIIILEGVDGVGKTTIAQELQKQLPLSTLIKLSGSPKDCDSNKYMQELYYKLYPFLDFVSLRQNIILDRFTTSERVYSKLFKAYNVSYLDDYEELLDDRLDILQVYLHLSPEKIQQRIEKKRAESPNEKHPDLVLTKKIYNRYQDVIADETRYATLLVNADNSVKDIVNEILAKIKLITGISLTDEIETGYSDISERDRGKPWEKLGITEKEYWGKVQKLENYCDWNWDS